MEKEERSKKVGRMKINGDAGIMSAGFALDRIYDPILLFHPRGFACSSRLFHKRQAFIMPSISLGLAHLDAYIVTDRSWIDSGVVLEVSPELVSVHAVLRRTIPFPPALPVDCSDRFGSSRSSSK